MRTGIDLRALAAKIEANRELKHDLVVDTAVARMEIDGDRKPLLRIADDHSYPIQPIAHRQISTHTNIPATYYDRMMEDAPALLADNVNTWLHLNPSRRMVRTLGGDMRAFLSDRYQRIEHEEIAEVVLPVLSDESGIKIVSAEATDRKLYLHAVTSRIQREVRKGDVVEAGVLIQNSEVGHGSVSIQALVWRLVCLNGMKMPDGAYRRNHVGRRVEDDETIEQVWADDTRRADDRAVLLKVRDTVRAALDEARFALRIAKLTELATDAKITGDPVKAIEVLAKKVNIAEGERGGILRSLIEGNGLTAWDMINAVTAQAHTADYDRAVEFESIGGRMAEMPATEWKAILQAA